MRQSFRKKWIVGILSAVFLFLTGVALVPETVYAKSFAPCTFEIKYPMEGESTLTITDTKGLYNGYKANTSYVSLTSPGELNGAPVTYTRTMVVYLSKTYDGYDVKPSETGWKIRLRRNDIGLYDRTITPSSVNVITETMSGAVTGYRVEITFSFMALAKIKELKLTAPSKFVFKDGDLADYGIDSISDTWYDIGGQIKWFPEGTTTAISSSTKLVGGQYYSVQIPVTFDTDYGHSVYVGLYNKAKGMDSALDSVTVTNADSNLYNWSGWYGTDDTYNQTTHIYTAVLENIPVVKQIEALKITGVKAPAPGDKPSVTGIALSTPDSNAKHPVDVDFYDTPQWSGKLDKYGNFIAGEHYTLTIKESLAWEPGLYTMPASGAFVKSKVSSNAGTVDSSSTDEYGWPQIVLGFDCPKINLSTATVTAADQTYTGSALTPAPTVVYNGETLVKDTDYTVAYANNTNEGTATVTVTGKGMYTGTAKGTFKITKKAGQSTETPTTTVKVGDVKTVSGAAVTVTAAPTATANGQVTYTKAPNKKKVTVPNTVAIEGKNYDVTTIAASAFTAKKIRQVTIGANVSIIKKNAFKKSKATKVILKTKLLKKKTVKGCLKSSKVKTVQVKVGKKKDNKKYVKSYKKIFTKKNAGVKVTVK